jgi:AGZA family xanthine/uracil permease-like MFS transporter
MNSSARYPLFAKRDLDGFFGLFIDNLVQLLLIVGLCAARCGIGRDSPLLLQSILPGAALSILAGNVFYAWQAHRLARREGRTDVTALPYGINTVSLLVYVFFVMGPAYDRGLRDGLEPAAAARLAWQMGLIACLGSGLIEFAGSFVAERIRRSTPRAALLSTLAGIAVGFISMTFALQIFQRPLVAMLPLAIILITYFSRVGFPLGLPGGFVAVLLGTACAWVLPAVLPATISGPPMSADAVGKAWAARALALPVFAGGELWAILRQPAEWIGFLSVIVPMGLFNVIGSLQNIESAEAGGDKFDTRSSLAVNGIGTIVAAAFGSCFPTTIYIGHPGWKGLGARAGYSTLNGLVITAICLTGTVGLISSIVPIDAGIAIVLWIGIIITAQAFQVTPTEHAPAVAVGLFPAIAAWGATVMQGSLIVAGAESDTAKTLQQTLVATDMAATVNGFLVHGMLVMERGYIFTCMILAAVSAFLIERRFYTAAAWSLVAAAFTAAGLMHAYQLSGNNFDFLFAFTEPREGALAFRAAGIVIGYLMFAAIFAAFGVYQGERKTDPGRELPIVEKIAD